MRAVCWDFLHAVTCISCCISPNKYCCRASFSSAALYKQPRTMQHMQSVLANLTWLLDAPCYATWELFGQAQTRCMCSQCGTYSSVVSTPCTAVVLLLITNLAVGDRPLHWGLKPLVTCAAALPPGSRRLGRPSWMLRLMTYSPSLIAFRQVHCLFVVDLLVCLAYLIGKGPVSAPALPCPACLALPLTCPALPCPCLCPALPCPASYRCVVKSATFLLGFAVGVCRPQC